MLIGPDYGVVAVNIQMQGSVKVQKSATTNNKGVAYLMQGIQTALNSTFTVTSGDASHSVGSHYQFDSSNPDVSLKLIDGSELIRLFSECYR